MRRLLVVIVLVAGSIVVLPASMAYAAAARSDFNGDGRGDLAVGVPGEDVEAILAAGAVNVLYGSAAGVNTSGDQFWNQDSSGVEGGAEAGDNFGSSLATGDFNNDGYADLAIGVPFEDVGLDVNAGAVNVLYGGATGLSSEDDQIWTQGSTGVAGDGVEPGDEFGASLAAGDLDGDGYADLAVGVPGEAVGAVSNAGAVNVLYGSSTGLTGTGSDFWTQDSTAINDTAETFDHFGFSVTVANFGKSSPADLVIGVPNEDLGGVDDVGAVAELFGTSAGVTATGDRLWSQDSSGVPGTAETGDGFGFSVAAANLGESSHADLAIGIPFEDVGTIIDAGAVNVLYGSTTGLTSTGSQQWTQNSSGIGDAAEDGDEFGFSLAAANLGKSSHADLAIGVPFEDLGTITQAGAVSVLYGSSNGVTSTDQFWTQDRSGVPGTAEDGDAFGWSLTTANLGISSHSDLAIGVIFEDVGAIQAAGAANVLYGSTTGLTSTGSQQWTQDSTGIAGDGAETGDLFGGALPGSRFFD
jgi:hypothetical protein